MNKTILSMLLCGFLLISITACGKTSSLNHEQHNIPSEKDMQRYEEIKKSFSLAMDKHIKSSFIYKDERNCYGFIEGNTTSDTLIKYKYLEKEDMLELDDVSYCKAVAKKYIVFLKNKDDVCDMKYDIYLSCKKFKTPGFDDLEYRSFSKFEYGTISYE